MRGSPAQRKKPALEQSVSFLASLADAPSWGRLTSLLMLWAKNRF